MTEVGQVHAARYRVAIAGLGLLLVSCQPAQPGPPAIPAEAIFLARNNPGVAAGYRVVAISARDGRDAADLGSTGQLLTKLNDRGEITEGYVISADQLGTTLALAGFHLSDRLTTRVIVPDSVAGGALVDVLAVGSVLVVKDDLRCEIVAFRAGSVLWHLPDFRALGDAILSIQNGFGGCQLPICRWFYDGGYFYLYVPPEVPHAVVATDGFIYRAVGDLGP